jgi:hypothetical protein
VREREGDLWIKVRACVRVFIFLFLIKVIFGWGHGTRLLSSLEPL